MSAMCEGANGDSVTGDGITTPPYFSRVACAKILMELQLHDVRLGKWESGRVRVRVVGVLEFSPLRKPFQCWNSC